jgi:hypothetical protein
MTENSTATSMEQAGRMNFFFGIFCIPLTRKNTTQFILK